MTACRRSPDCCRSARAKWASVPNVPGYQGIEDLTALAYTGGTTGEPKGVMNTYRSGATMVAIMLAEWQWPTDLRHLVCTPQTAEAFRHGWLHTGDIAREDHGARWSRLSSCCAPAPRRPPRYWPDAGRQVG